MNDNLGSFPSLRVLSHVPAERSDSPYPGVSKVLRYLPLKLLLFADPLPLGLLLAHLDVGEILESTAWLQEQLVDVPKFQIFFPKESQVRGLACPP